MRGDSIRAGFSRDVRSANRVGMIAAARIPDRRDVIDVDAEAESAGHAAERLPGLIAGMAASSGGTASAS
jgi:hypothetical protein